MTVKEFYEWIHGDYEDVLLRLPTDDLIIYFVSKFPEDETYSELLVAVENGDIEASFEAAHTLKGLAANLAFTELYHATEELTNQLRPCNQVADKGIVERVKSSYHRIVDGIQEGLSDEPSVTCRD